MPLKFLLLMAMSLPALAEDEQSKNFCLDPKAARNNEDRPVDRGQ